MPPSLSIFSIAIATGHYDYWHRFSTSRVSRSLPRTRKNVPDEPEPRPENAHNMRIFRNYISVRSGEELAEAIRKGTAVITDESRGTIPPVMVADIIMCKF